MTNFHLNVRPENPPRAHKYVWEWDTLYPVRFVLRLQKPVEEATNRYDSLLRLFLSCHHKAGGQAAGQPASESVSLARYTSPGGGKDGRRSFFSCLGHIIIK